MNVQQRLLLLSFVLLLATLEYGDTSCPSSTDNEDTKPLYLLAMLADYDNVERNLIEMTALPMDIYQKV